MNDNERPTFLTIIRPEFMRFCDDACRAALFNHILFRLAGKCKDQPKEKIQSGEITWYATNEQIVQEMNNAWGTCKIRKEVNFLIDMGLFARKGNAAWKVDRTKYFSFGQPECRKFLDLCERFNICLVHLDLPAEVKHLIYVSNANDKSIKCICLIHQMQAINLSDANDISIGAIPIEDYNRKTAIEDSNRDTNITAIHPLVASATQTHTDGQSAEYASLPIPVTYAEALTYLQPHGPYDGLDAVQVMKLARKLWVEAHPQGEINDGQSADNQQTLSISLSMADEVSPISTLPTAEAIPASEARQQTRSQPRLHDAEKPIAHPTSKASQASDTPQFALSPAAIRKQHKQRQDAIIALLCEVTGEKVVKSSKNTRGAELLAESDATDEEIKIVIRALRADPFWCKQMTLLTVAEQFNSRLSMAKMAIPDAAQPAWNGGVYNIFYDTTLTPEEIERQVTSEFYNQEKWEASLRKAAN